MPSEKFFVHKEDGSLVRLKGRLVRFLDEEPPTGSDKSAIRTALEVSPDAEGLVQADVGTGPQNLVLHQHLGTMAYADADGVSVASLEITDKIDLSGAPTQQLEVYGDAPTVRVTDTSYSVALGDSIGKLEFYGNDGSSGGPNVRTRIDTVAEAAAGNYYGLAISTSASNAAPVERIRVANNGNTGIGTASPDKLLHIKSSDPVIRLEDSAPDGIYAQIDGAGGGLILTADSTSGAASSAIKFRIDGSTSASDKWAIYNSGNLVSLTPGNIEISNGNLIIGTSGKGIDFGSGDTLSDYQVGSWTPGLSTGAGESITYAAQTGNYTKIGSLVFCTGRIQITTAATYGSANHLQITGLPFTVSDASLGMSFSYGGDYNDPSLFQVGDITGAHATANGASSFYLQRGAYGGTSDVYYRVALLNTTCYVKFTVTYRTGQ